MPLDTTNFHPQGPVKSVDLMQFVNLFTGVMTDQPVTHSNSLTIGGNQGLTTVPLRVYGAVGQNTNLIDLYVDKNAAQPGFGFSAAGRFAWGPGGAAPQDTFLSRIALQNGHATDTPGLLITPTLEVTGNITTAGTVQAGTYGFSNGATLTGPTGTPNTLVITQDLNVARNATVSQDLTVTRDLYEGRYLSFPNPSPRIFFDMSGATQVSRLMFQTSTVNTNTAVGVIPNGTGTNGQLHVYGGSDPDNAIVGQFLAQGGSAVQVIASKFGTASFPQLAFATSGTIRALFHTDGRLVIGQAVGTSPQIWSRTGAGANDLNLEAPASGASTAVNAQGPVRVSSNVYFDGTSWQRYSTGAAGGTLNVSAATLAFFTVAAGANPATMVSNLYTDLNGLIVYPGLITLTNSGTYLSGNGSNMTLGAGAGAVYVRSDPGLFVRNTASSAYANLACGGITAYGNVLYFTDSNHSVISDGTNIIIQSSNGGTYLRSSATHVQTYAAAYTAINASAFTVQSSRTVKDNIVPLANPLSLLLDERVHGVRYIDKNTGRAQVGFVADDFAEVLPEVVDFGDDGAPQFLNYGAVGALTFEAVKALYRELQDLRQEVAALRAA